MEEKKKRKKTSNFRPTYYWPMPTDVLCASSDSCDLFASESNLFSERDLARHWTSHLVLEQGSAYLLEKCVTIFFLYVTIR